MYQNILSYANGVHKVNEKWNSEKDKSYNKSKENNKNKEEGIESSQILKDFNNAIKMFR